MPANRNRLSGKQCYRIVNNLFVTFKGGVKPGYHLTNTFVSFYKSTT